MKMNYKKIDQLINDFLVDENLFKVLNFQQNINIFDICKLNEPKYSSFLSWLLNPREAHGLNDLFIKELLKECIKEFNAIGESKSGKLAKNPFFNNFSIYKLDRISFLETNVYTEFKSGKLKKNSSKYPAVDICLVNEEENREIMIFIENKIGAPETDNQAQRYADYLDNKYQEDYYPYNVT